MEYLIVFVIGGLFCVIGQILMDTTKLTTPRILVLFVVAGAILSGLGLYEPLVELGKNGATIPLPGFGHTLAQGAISGARENGFFGALGGAIEASAAGVGVAITFGYIIALIFSPKTKR